MSQIVYYWRRYILIIRYINGTNAVFYISFVISYTTVYTLNKTQRDRPWTLIGSHICVYIVSIRSPWLPSCDWRQAGAAARGAGRVATRPIDLTLPSVGGPGRRGGRVASGPAPVCGTGSMEGPARPPPSSGELKRLDDKCSHVPAD